MAILQAMIKKKMTFYLVFVTLLALLLNLQFLLHVFNPEPFLATIGLSGSSLIYLFLGIAMLGGISSVIFSGLIARFTLGVTLIEVPRTYLEKWLFASVERQARQLGIATPRIGVFYASDMNAFTTGWRKKNTLFAVSSGLLENLDQEELEAVIGHELAHIVNGDMMSLAIARGMVVSLTEAPARVAGLLIDRLLLRCKSSRGPVYQLVYWCCMISIALLPHFVVMWISRQREYSADRISAMLNGGEKMIYALQRLFNNHYNQSQQTVLSLSPVVLEGLVEEIGNIRHIFSSHPPLHKRIQVIQDYLEQQA